MQQGRIHIIYIVIIASLATYHAYMMRDSDMTRNNLIHAHQLREARYIAGIDSLDIKICRYDSLLEVSQIQQEKTQSYIDSVQTAIRKRKTKDEREVRILVNSALDDKLLYIEGAITAPSN